jgi:hypothetical protein
MVVMHVRLRVGLSLSNSKRAAAFFAGLPSLNAYRKSSCFEGAVIRR